MDPTPNFEAPKSNRNIIIGVIAAIVLCCCCLVTSVGGYYGYKAYVAGQQALNQIENIDIPTSVPLDPSDPNSPDVQIPDITGTDVPQGGLADDSTRYTAWLAVQIVASISGCTTPTAEGTTISVSQEPNSAGEWKEEWNVNCGSGVSKPYTVTFTPENGIVNVNVELPSQ